MMEKLWGDNFFDPTTKKWTKKPTGAESCKRGFVQFVYDPIKTIIEAAMNDNKVKLFGLCDKLGISGKLKSEDKELMGKPLMKRIMQAWLPAHEVSHFSIRFEEANQNEGTVLQYGKGYVVWFCGS
jgi:elongation factor 2